jgi:autotransporter translocation and assembly factor TamB
MNFRNGILKIAPLENSLTGVEGQVHMHDNILEIESFTGFLQKPTPRGKLRIWFQKAKDFLAGIFFPQRETGNNPNLNISGQIDFTELFHPAYNLHLKGNQIYIRTLLAQQEGIVNGDFSIVGKDTIDIDGEIEVGEFIIRNEFKRSSKMSIQRRPPLAFTNYNIHTIIPGNLYFRNSQLDCELEGEMWIVRSGPEPFLFSGELNVRKGKFFYYGWEFTDVAGVIIFDPIEFNPKLDIEARVNLATYRSQTTQEQVSSYEEDYAVVRLTGDLEKPVLQFESDKYTQSDILMFLTRTPRSGSDLLSQENLPSDALNVFGNYFERQVERSLGRISGLDEFELRTRGNLLSDFQIEDWSVLLGQRLTSNLYLTYERKFSLIEPEQQLGLEYRLNRYNSIIGEVTQGGLIRINYRYKYNY